MDMVFGRSIYRIARNCFWAAMASLFILWALSTISWPFARDQGILAWAGSIMRQGGVPYRDAWDVKGPLAVIPFALAQAVFGPNMWGIRVFDLLMMLINLAALGWATYQVWDRKAAQYSLLFAALFFSWLNFAITCQPDGWCGCAITIIVALLSTTKRDLSPRLVAAGSFLIGLCVLQKPVYAAFVLLFLPFIGNNRRTIMRCAIAAAAGFLLPIIAAVTYFGMHHAFDTFVTTFLLFNLRAHLRSVALDLQTDFFLDNWGHFLPIVTGLPLAAFGAVSTMNRNLRFGILLVLWMSLNIFIVVIQGKYFEYQWVPLIPPIALGAGFALRQLRDIRPSAAAAFLLVFIVPFIDNPVRSIKGSALYLTGMISRDAYDAHFVYLNKNHYNFSTIRQLATYVADHSSRNETVQVWGFDAGINYLAQRAAPSRFGYTYPLQIGEKNPYEASYRAEFLTKIRAQPPRYVLVPSDDAFGLMPIASDRSFNEFTAFSGFVREHYTLEKTIANFTLYRLR